MSVIFEDSHPGFASKRKRASELADPSRKGEGKDGASGPRERAFDAVAVQPNFIML
jgi:hypothetical protein